MSELSKTEATNLMCVLRNVLSRGHYPSSLNEDLINLRSVSENSPFRPIFRLQLSRVEHLADKGLLEEGAHEMNVCHNLPLTFDSCWDSHHFLSRELPDYLFEMTQNIMAFILAIGDDFKELDNSSS